MLVEGLGSVTFVNGVLRVQAVAVGASGEVIETGNIEIPGNKVGDVINGLNNAASDISDKLVGDTGQTTSEKKENSKNKKKKK